MALVEAVNTEYTGVGFQMQATFEETVPGVEWPTLTVLAGAYFGLGLIVWFNAELPWWIILPIGAYCACLHGSLQHEILHGHPTRSRRINHAMIFISPQLWLPFGRYRDLHLSHHNDANLTCPVRDPESYYMLPVNWASMPGWRRRICDFNNTLFGRMLIGPAISIAQFWPEEFLAMARGRLGGRNCWFAFAASSAFILLYLYWCGMPFWQYVLLIAYPSISLALVRSYCEHQAADNIGERTIIVEASALWSLLFLNNNLHIAHHERPAIAWYNLPRFYASEKERLVLRNGNYLKLGYGQIFRSYFFHAKETVVHPNPDWIRRS